jgi:hypothetical protein
MPPQGRGRPRRTRTPPQSAPAPPEELLPPFDVLALLQALEEKSAQNLLRQHLRHFARGPGSFAVNKRREPFFL